MSNIFNYTSIQLLLFLVFLPASAQISPEMSAEIKDIQIESRKKDPLGIFPKFSISGIVILSGLDDLEHSDRRKTVDDSSESDLEAIKKAFDKQMKALQDENDYQIAAIPILLQIGKKIAKNAVTKYPEIVPMPLEGGPTFPRGKSGTITFFLREGLVNGNRFMLTQINVSGYLSVENQKDFQFCNVYTRQTPVVGLGDVQEACEELLKQFYGAYSSARSARVSD